MVSVKYICLAFLCLILSYFLMAAIFRLELAEERAQNLTGQKTANECMDILKVFINI